MPENQVVIVGGGITGTVTALTLQAENPGIACVLLEATDRLGGKLRTETLRGVQIEAGADSFLTKTSEPADLCREVGLENQLVSPALFGGLVWDERGATRLPRGTVMGVPTSPRTIARARNLSVAGKVRALGDLVLPGRLHGNDISVGELIRKRFGPEVLERMVDPILAGTKAGEADRMSLRAALPQVDRAARRHRSVMAGLRADPDQDGHTVPPFFAPRSGMEALVRAVAARCAQVQFEMANPATRVAPGKRGGYIVHTRNGARFETSAVVFALPAHAVAPLVADMNPAASEGLLRVGHASVAVISLLFDAGSLKFPAGSSGFLVPSSEKRMLSAGTWWSLKWPHTSPPDVQVVRCFVGRAGRSRALDKSDDELMAGATDELNQLLGASARPIEGKVTRWDDGLPQYQVGHLGRISRIEGALESNGGIVLAGADYRGSGIPDCIRQARIAARRVAAWL